MGEKKKKNKKNKKKWFDYLKKKDGKLSITRVALLVSVLMIVMFFTSCLGIYILSEDVSWLKNKNPKTTELIKSRNEERKSRGMSKIRLRYWVSYKTLPKHLVQAIRVSEDDKFFQHNGFDLSELKTAILDKIFKGKELRGASTISQQVVKNLFLSDEKSFLRKFVEIPLTIKLEKNLSKRRIFEIYVNIIEFGEGIFGIESAARHYFGKPAATLNLNESVFLAAILNKPKFYQKHPNSKALVYRKQNIRAKMREYGYIE